MLMFSYFLKIVLEEAQSFACINSVHRIVSQGGCHLKSEEKRKRSRYTSRQSNTVGLQDMSRFWSRRFCSTVRKTGWKHRFCALRKT